MKRSSSCGKGKKGSLSSLCSLFHTFHREIEMRVGDFVWLPVRYGDRLPVCRDLFRQPSALLGMVGRAFDSGAHPFSGCSRRLLTLASHLLLRWFRPAWFRVHPGFIFKFPDLRCGFSIHSVTNPLVIEDMQLNLFDKAKICLSRSTAVNGLGIKWFV